jgi:hypothetical protein
MIILAPLAANAPTPWALIDSLGDTPFLPEGLERPAIDDEVPVEFD